MLKLSSCRYNGVRKPSKCLIFFVCLVIVAVCGFLAPPSRRNAFKGFSCLQKRLLDTRRFITFAVTGSNEEVAKDTTKRSYIPRAGGSDQSTRVYVPRNDVIAGRQSQGSAGPRVYKPRFDNSKANDGSNSSAAGSVVSTPRTRQEREQTYALSNPQLLIRFRVPRVKSALKRQLETLQDSYREQSESGRSREYGGGSGSDRWSGGAGSNVSPAYDSFDALFSQASSRKAAAKGGKSKYEDATWGDGGKPKSSSNRKSKGGGVDDDDEELDDVEYEEDDDDEEEYYGDEVSKGLSSVSAGDLQTLEQEGYSLEEIQMALYGEYGVKASLSAIKRRLQDDKMERKGRKRTGKTRRDRSKARSARYAQPTENAITLPDGPIQIIELAKMMEVGGGDVVKHLMLNMGIMASMTQSIDVSVAKQVVEAFGKKLAGGNDDDEMEEEEEEEEEVELAADGKIFEKVARPPVVTIMGHVDHGKTTLLDSIRKTQVAKGEAGGITQGISAFKVKANDDNYVTFIDTPGHAAFSDMRRRGANVTDIVVLVVAADDGIMEQTKECIAAAKTASCPIVVAVNKIDKEGADPGKVITDLMSYDILAEEFGGDVQVAKVSAKSGTGIDDLLEKILLQAEVMNLKAAVETPAEGTVIESRVDKGMGTVVTALVQKGSLKVGDYVLAGPSWGRVRRLISDQKTDLETAGPSTPVQIVGMNSVPNAGDTFTVTPSEAAAREVAEARQKLARQAAGSLSSASILAQAVGFAEGVADTREVIKVPIVIKADVSGSVEAIKSAIDELQVSDDEATCRADIVLAGVGDVTSSDVAIAAAAKAKVIAFNVAAGLNAMDDARSTNVEIGYYNVVYDLLDEIEKVIKSTLAPPPPGLLVGRAEIKKVFKLGKVGKVAGCMITEGVVKSDSQIRILRGRRNSVHIGTLSSLKVVKDAVAEVPAGSECGMSFTDFQDFEEGDIIECFVSGGDSEDS